MSKRSRDRHLAKLAARRQAERDAHRRRRQRALGTVATTAGVVLLVVAGLVIFNGGDDAASPSPTVSPSGSPSESPSSPTPQAKPGKQTGTVDPQPAPAEVACGAEAPETAGKPKPQFSGPPPMKIDPEKTYIATMETSCGTIEIELDPKTAPQTVNSFVFLANHGYFDGQYIHRIDTSIDVLQGGDPTGTGTGGPGYSIPDELPGRRAVCARRVRHGERRREHRRQPVLHHHGRQRAQPGLQPELHDLRPRHPRTRCGATHPEAPDQGPEPPRPRAIISGQAPKQAVYFESVTITEE